MPVLNKCPECGSKDLIIMLEPPKFIYYWVGCENCGEQSKSFRTKEQAINAWNNKNLAKH